jgi:hypothetical protein
MTRIRRRSCQPGSVLAFDESIIVLAIAIATTIDSSMDHDGAYGRAFEIRP